MKLHTYLFVITVQSIFITHVRFGVIYILYLSKYTILQRENKD